VLPYHFAGATVALLADPRPEAVLTAMAQHRVTAMMAVPTVWRRLVDAPERARYDVSAFRRAMGSSDAMPLDLLQQVLGSFGPPGQVTWTQTYGLTEAGCILTYLPPEDHTRKLGSAGKPHAQADLVIADPERAGEPDWPMAHQLPPGAIGEVVARTEHAMNEYWNKPEQTATALRDGWLHSGDLGWLDEEGYLFISGRLKDLVVSGGEKIYPAEVEPVLRQYPGVREVAVTGVPDRIWGESVLAAIVPEPGAQIDPEAFRRWARARVAGFKTPKYVVVVDELPRTTGTNKVQKAVLRQRYEHLGDA
jgi:acyl-CoA synthetase (AMP-forming)/AMP-acid ligase II